MKPSLHHMIQSQCVHRGIQSKRVLNALKQVDRVHFVAGDDRAYAYGDYPLCIGEKQTISQPYMVALMSESLDINPDDYVLEIGTGSGYQTAILAMLSDHVYTIERHASLSIKAKKTLESLNIHHVFYHIGDGALGWPEVIKFDKIMVTAAAQNIPKELIKQLKTHGKMIIPVGHQLYQDLLLITKKNNHIDQKVITQCRFVPLISKDASD